MAHIITFPSAIEYWLQADNCPKEFYSFEDIFNESSYDDKSNKKLFFSSNFQVFSSDTARIDVKTDGQSHYKTDMNSFPFSAACNQNPDSIASSSYQEQNSGKSDQSGNKGSIHLGDIHLSLPLHVLVPGNSSRNNTSQLHYHVLPKNIPAESFVKIDESLYVICPELCFLIAARHYEIPRLTVLANDLCSIYRLDFYSEFLQSGRYNITTRAKIVSYLKQIKDSHGIIKARRAIKYASDRSNSPMESKIAALIRLPLSLGGFALPEASLNHEVTLTEKASDFLGRNTCCCDIAWPKLKVVLEYDSSLVHLTANQHAYDKKRVTALMMSGYTVISITWGHLNNPDKVETLFSELRKVLKHKINYTRFNKCVDDRQATVKKLLYSSYFKMVR